MSEPLRHILPSFIFFLSYLKPCHLSAGLNRLLIFNRITYSNPFFAVSFVVWCHCSGSRAVCCGQSLLLEQILFLPSPKQVGAYFWKKKIFQNQWVSLNTLLPCCGYLIWKSSTEGTEKWCNLHEVIHVEFLLQRELRHFSRWSVFMHSF